MNDKDLYVSGTEEAVKKPQLPDIYKKRIAFVTLLILTATLIFGGIKVYDALTSVDEPGDDSVIMDAETTEGSDNVEDTNASIEVTETPTETIPEATEPPVTEPPVIEPPVTEPENPTLVTYFNVPLSEDLQDHIFAMCEKKNVDPIIIIAMIYRESSYNPSNMGDNGMSYGLMQIQPKWHQARMDRLGCTDLLDPYQNVTVGIDLFGDFMSLGKGVEWALMAYNDGGAEADRKAAEGIITSYVTRVLQTVKDLESAKYYK